MLCISISERLVKCHVLRYSDHSKTIMNTFWIDFATVIGVHILGLISPGPDFAVTVKNSLSHGKRAGVFTALGIAAGCSLHISYSIIGISYIITQSILLLNVIKFIGAGYLIYLGIKALRSKKTDTTVTAQQSQQLYTAGQAWRSGFFTNILNPKATLFFLSLFTVVMKPNTPVFTQLIYGSVMVVTAGAWFSAVSYVLTRPIIQRRFQKIQHWLDRGMGVVLIALGIKVALTK